MYKKTLLATLGRPVTNQIFQIRENSSCDFNKLWKKKDECLYTRDDARTQNDKTSTSHCTMTFAKIRPNKRKAMAFHSRHIKSSFSYDYSIQMTQNTHVKSLEKKSHAFIPSAYVNHLHTHRRVF